MASPVSLVDPLIDTANRRFFFFSSACRPFGMVNLSPDTAAGGAWQAGYRYDSEFIRWFSHLHAWQLAALPVLPCTGEMRGHTGSENYGSRFTHERETVSPGYHSVYLENYGIDAELTATDRVGFHRYTFPSEGDRHVLLDLGAEVGPTEMSDALARPADERTIVGYVENAPTRRRPKPVRVHFVMVFDRPFERFGGWKGDSVIDECSSIQGADAGGYFRFDGQGWQVLQMKVALSFCGIEHARENLVSELPHWEFERVREETQRCWNDWLGRIEIEGGTPEQQAKFYTDLYHSLLGRRRVNDADGSYLDMTGDELRIRHVGLGDERRLHHQHHNSDAFWGAQWSLSLLWSIAYPDVVHNFCNTFLDLYRNGGLIPRGPSGGNYTFVMTSATSTPFLVSAWHKGIRSFDIETAYEGMVKNHMPGGLMSKAGYEHDTCIGGGVDRYIELGYVPHEVEAEAFHCAGAAQTLEYAYADWCLAQLAATLGRDSDYERFMQRSQNYRNIYDEEVGFMRPRHEDGSWVEPFDPMSPDGWVEGNAWHYLWHVPHNVEGLMALMGGRQVFINRLNELFEKAQEHDFVAPHGGHHQGYLDYGNQPCTYIAHLFNQAGAPWLAQKWVRRIMEQAKSDVTPWGGYGGDEDQGQMGSLNALMALGLFDVRAGCDREPRYELTSPVFDRAVIHLDDDYYSGADFVIETRRDGPADLYIQSAKLDGEPLKSSWFPHSQLAKGGKLQILLGPGPNREWGKA
ncbi:MAG: GH92 family glycosyl hydrolase [Candidatus Brocadiia bacterium]